MKRDEALATIFEELQNTKEQFKKISTQLDSNKEGIVSEISESKNLLETINDKIQKEEDNNPKTQSVEIDIEKMKLLGNEICQSMEKQIWAFKNEKKGMFISNRLSLLLIGIVLFSFLFSATSLFMWQKKSYESQVWKNTAETHFEQYQSLKKDKDR